MTNVTPYNLVIGPGQVWVGPVGETFPDVDETPAGNWVDLGKTEGDVVINHVRATVAIRTNQSAMPQKEALVSADETVTFSLAEIDQEAYAKILQDVTVTTTAAGAGTPGVKSFAISPSYSKVFAWLIRVPSAHEDGYTDYQYDRGSVAGDHGLAYSRGAKTIIPVEVHMFESIATPGQFGVVEAFTADAV
jgi:hypothetical protein